MNSFLRSVAYATAPAIAFVYTAGYVSGQWLHQCNQDLAEFHASFFQSQSYTPLKTKDGKYEFLDWKTSYKAKKNQHLCDYRMQLGAYVQVLEQMYDIEIN